MLLLRLFDRPNSPAKVGNFCKLLLDCFQPLMPVGVSNLGLRVIAAAAATILVVQLLQVSDFCAEAGNLFPKHFEVVHSKQDSIRIGSQVITSVRCAKQL
jgi:hypothetical protein